MWRGWITVIGLIVCRWAWAVWENDWAAVDAAAYAIGTVGVVMVALALLMPDKEKEEEDPGGV